MTSSISRDALSLSAPRSSDTPGALVGSLFGASWKKRADCWGIRPGFAKSKCSSTGLAAAKDVISLGKSDIKISHVGLGTIAWGDTGQGFGKRFGEKEVKDVFNSARSGGVSLFDTAEMYGYQGAKTGNNSEGLLGRAARVASLDGSQNPPVLATKYFTIPWTNFLIGGPFRFGKTPMLKALEASLERLGTRQVDLWQVHFPFPTYPARVLADGLEEALQRGLTRTVGVCNFSAEQLEELQGLLAPRGISLVSNQVKYSLLDRKPEQGLLQKCRELGVTLIAHSPLQRGRLTGRALAGTSKEKDEKLYTLLKLLEFIGMVSGSKTVTQVALNYLVSKGAVPIPGAKTVEQAEEQAGALGWRLDDNEVGIIDEKLAALSL